MFEDIGTTIYKGQVLKPLDRANPPRQQNNQNNDPHDPLTGRIRYRAADHSEVEVPFGDKDQVICRVLGFVLRKSFVIFFFVFYHHQTERRFYFASR